MPSDLVIDVRQISSYPLLPASSGAETVLLQQGSMGAPYASITTADFVATALNAAGPALGVGVSAAVGAANNQIFTGTYAIEPGGGVVFNAYSAAAGILNWGSGFSGTFALDASVGMFVWELGSGQVGQPVVWSDVMQLSMAGDLSLPKGTLAVARDPANAAEVVNLNYLANNTVRSFNNRIGRVTLNAADIYSALQPDSPLATQNYVQQSIFTAMTQGPLVAYWNGRTGNVNLMLSDITCVFFQSGQQPISPTPPPTSNDYSIATTAWVTDFVGTSGNTESVNVLDYGADPTGANDSSAAFNAAAATVNAYGQNNSVYVPSGNYRINNTISLINGQTLFGDGRGNTRLFCDGNFNMSAASVIMLQATTQFLDPGPEIRGITISMIQNMSATLRSQIIQFPPVISCQANCGRFKVLNSRIEGAWNGITTNGTNTPFSIWDLELGALNEGLQIGLGADGPRDFCHLHGLHFWQFGCPQAVFVDGNTTAMHVGRADGLDCTDCSVLTAKILVDSANSSTTIIHFTNLKLDADQSSLTINGGNHIHIANFYATAAAARAQPAVTVNSNANVQIVNWYSHSSSAVADINVIAGWLSIENAHITHYNQSSPIATTQGILKLVNTTVWASTAGAYTQALIQQSGAASNLVIDGFKVENLGNASSGTAIRFASDNVGNRLGSVNLPNNWVVSLPGSAPNTQVHFPAGAVFGALAAPAAPQIMLGSNTAAVEQRIALNAVAGQARDFFLLTAGSPRWWFGADSNGETGGNVGSNFVIGEFDDSGNYLYSALTIFRATGMVTLQQGLQIATTAGPTIRGGAGAPSGAQPNGSLWLRTDGTTAARLYVSNGSTWAAVAGV